MDPLSLLLLPGTFWRLAVSTFKLMNLNFKVRWEAATGKRGLVFSHCASKGAPLLPDPNLRFVLFLGLLFLSDTQVRATPAVFHGLPFSRAYTFDEIGYVPRGARLDFDSFDRLAIVREGTLVVLNDDTWLSVSNDSQVAFVRIIKGEKNEMYYGARGKWGAGSLAMGQTIRVSEYNNVESPTWTRNAYFDDLCRVKDGAYFGSWNGTVYWDARAGRNVYFEIPGETKLLQVGERVFVWVRNSGIFYLDVEARSLVRVASAALGDSTVDYSCRLNERQTLLGLNDGRFVCFDGKEFSAWPVGTSEVPSGPILALASLSDGKVAVSIGGRGVFLLRADGELLESWTTPQFQQVSDIANNEPGVLWLMNEDSVEKILYDGPLSKFDPTLGARVRWPLLVSHRNTTYAISEGRLYEVLPAIPAEPSRFRDCNQNIPGGVWSMASDDEHLLVGSGTTLYELREGMRQTIGSVAGLAHLKMPRKNLVIAIGSQEIAAFAFDGERWIEAAPRIPGLGYSPISICSHSSVWVERASEGVAQVKFLESEGRLKVSTLRPWPESGWTSVSILGDTVVLTGKSGEVSFLDDRDLTAREAPILKSIIERTKPDIVRIVQDHRGRYWASQRSGVVLFTISNGTYEMDDRSFNLLYDLYPTVQATESGDIWFSGHQSLFHVDNPEASNFKPPVKPKMLAIFDSRTGKDYSSNWDASVGCYRLASSENIISMRMFSGSYAERAPPYYEFQLAGENWSRVDSGSLVSLRGVEPGFHTLRIRPGKEPHLSGAITEVNLEIAPPWYRSLTAFLTYPLVASLLCLGLVNIGSYSTRRRNRALAKRVEEQTQQLKETMNRLTDETRLAATLAERDRISGEVHDSLQQGLSGAILQLDSTLKLPAVAPEIRGRLSVVRSMLSFTRNEVQHVLWNKESLFLENGGLVQAIGKMVSLINSTDIPLQVVVEGGPRDFESETKLHLVRITQEATTNAVRHSGAREILILIRFLADGLLLRISDDGAGFVVEAALAESTGHFGLRGMRSRAAKLKGELHVESVRGKGTSVSFTMKYGQE